MVKLQAHNTNTHVKEYRKALHCASRILSTEGGETQSCKPQLQAIFLSGAFAGAIISFILCLAELVKCRMQVQGRDTAVSNYVRYSGHLDCALATMKSEGAYFVVAFQPY